MRPDRADTPDLIGALLAGMPPRTHVVLLSEKDADYAAPDGWALRAERVVRGSGRSWTILRLGWFMQVFTDPRFYRDLVADSGALPFASGGAGVAWIDARDIAAVAELALLDAGHAGRVYELSGPEVLSLPRTAELLSAAVGRPAVHQEVAIDETVTGTGGLDRELATLTFERVHAGSFAVVTDTVERVTGRPAGTLQAFLADSEPTPGRPV